MKKTAIVLSVLMILSVCVFTGCGSEDRNTAPAEEPAAEGIIDETEKGAEDLGNDMVDGAENMMDDAKDMLDGDDSTDRVKEEKQQ